MKEETLRAMSRLGYFLPEGWSVAVSNAGAVYTYNSTDVQVSVKLTNDFELVLQWHSALQVSGFTVPYVVMFAMYLDHGMHALKPEEAQAVALLTQQRDKLQHENGQLSIKLIAADGREKDLRERLTSQTQRRKKACRERDNYKAKAKANECKVFDQRKTLRDHKTKIALLEAGRTEQP